MKYFFVLFFLSLCNSPSKRELVIYKISYTCGCSETQAKYIGASKILEQGLDDYYKREKVILEPEVEEELFQIPTVYLENFSLYKKEQDLKKSEQVYEAKGAVSKDKLEVFLDTKKKEIIDGHKVYTNRGTGSRGLQLILEYSKKKRAERKEDRDKYYKDRIDMLEKIKSR